MLFEPVLPIDASLPELRAVLAERRSAVLVAPPGAGKTTRVPLALLDEPWAAGSRILLLSPRRIAARAAANRMAATLGERPGGRVGYRLRMDSRVSERTRIEVLTEGVFTRTLLSDPLLEGVACVVFDEFHERSLDADLGLALALDTQSALREDLRVVVMSATLDGAQVAGMLGDAPVLESAGRMHPVNVRYLGRDVRTAIEQQVADATLRALSSEPGSVLCFLPGAREIERAARLIAGRAPTSVDVRPLYGALSPEDQDAAIAPSPAGRRKVVLATSIAETSLTIEGVRVVIDSGLSRRPRYDVASGLASLETVRASRSSCEQRAGRAGRLEPGVCWRLWDEAETRALPAYDRPEILEADLSDLVLSLGEWGVSDPSSLRWLDSPPLPAWSAAQRQLAELGAVDDRGAITPLGRRLARIALAPALANMLLQAGQEGVGLLAAELAVLISEPGLCGRDIDLRARLERLRREGGRAQSGRDLARRLLNQAQLRAAGGEVHHTGLVLALGFPTCIAKARRDRSGEYLLANGRGVVLDPADPLAEARFLVVADLSGRSDRTQVLAAAPIEESVILERFSGHIVEEDTAELDVDSRTVRARRRRRLGRIVLQDAPMERPAANVLAQAWRAAVAKRGMGVLPEAPQVTQLRARIALLRTLEPDGGWPDWSDAALSEIVQDWLSEDLASAIAGEPFPQKFMHALSDLLTWEQRRRLPALTPERFESPAGGSALIDYTDPAGPAVSLRLQELFGLAEHPSICAGRVGLILRLLSPGHRPVQTTADLPGFWRGSYAQVRSELRGRYPRHPWPEDPLNAEPTRRAKPRPS